MAPRVSLVVARRRCRIPTSFIPGTCPITKGRDGLFEIQTKAEELAPWLIARAPVNLLYLSWVGRDGPAGAASVLRFRPRRSGKQERSRLGGPRPRKLFILSVLR